MQELVRSVVDGYWSLVQARVEIWARKQQVKQLEYAYKRLEAQRRVELADRGDTAQAKVSLEQFRANLIAQEARLLDLEAALLNALGLPPVPNMRIIPVTPPRRDMVNIDWDQLIATAAQQRPDVIERKLAIEAIQQQLIISSNETLPQLDAVALTRLNGLSADTRLGVVRSDAFQATDVQIGLDIQAPLGQRAARAALRQQQLNLARERSNLQQQLHQATHDLALQLAESASNSTLSTRPSSRCAKHRGSISTAVSRSCASAACVTSRCCSSMCCCRSPTGGTPSAARRCR